jgi:hypothetical protein
MKKTLVAILATVVFLLSSLGPAFYIQTAQAADPSDWYTIVNGVLTSDYYLLYPYLTNSIDFGLSKYGEMISYDPVTGMGVGLQYPGYDSVGTYDQTLETSRDPFASEFIDPKLWLNGWLIDVRYTHRTLRDRRILAMAMFADMAAYGGEWIVGHPYPFNLAPHGGRKTTGYAETEDLQVLYNGPRRYVALSVTHLYDWEDSDLDGVVEHPDETWPVVDIRLTFIFNKVKKQVIILKDIKQVISGKELDSPLDVQFSNREEWDLGPEELEYGSYAHFYHQQLETCFGPEWHMAGGIYREWVEDGYALEEVPVYMYPNYGPPIVQGSVRVYVNGVFMEEGEDYDINYDTGAITWHIPITYDDWVEVVYKLHKGEYISEEFVPYKGVPHLYDLAQIISGDYAYVGWKAFWPTLSDYTVDGWAQALQPLIWVNDDDFVPVTDEPDIPFVIGEWDFMLGKGYPMQFRGVEVVGLTDLWDGSDAQMNEKNIVDREVWYQLNEVFNPWDLNDAVHKETRRHVWIDDVISLSSVTLPERPFRLATWDAYCSFSERVLLNGSLLVPRRAGRATYDYYVTTSNGYATIWFTSAVTGHLKILYSTDVWYSNWGSIDITWVDEIEHATSVDISKTYTYTIIDPLGANHTLYIKELGFTVTSLTALAEDHTFVLEGTMDFYEEDFKVFKEGKTMINCYWWDQEGPHGGRSFRHVEDDGIIEVDFYNFWMQWFITPPLGDDLHIDWLHLDVDYTITVFYNATTGNYTITTDFSVNGAGGTGLSGTKGSWTDQLYVEHVAGRYEWITVGRDAHSVDSLGAALVSAAFKNKQVEIGIGGMDMKGADHPYNIPYVLHKFGTGDTFQDYFITPDTTDPGQRLTLRDDWCTTWPVSSSNIIAVGGPLANWVSMYFNDFIEAFYAAPWFTPYGYWSGKLAALTCWNKTAYENIGGETGIGYAMIGTYKDINGTVGFVIWGLDGRDTYYATKFFHEEIIFELQNFPPCATSIIIEIDYYDPEHPTFTIPEVLGTISETLVEGWKGGIHDP